MNTLKIKSGDTVAVISGREKGKKGKVLSVDPKAGMLVVEGVNMISRHTKPRRQGDPGGIIKLEGRLRACKVQILCKGCKKPTRIGYQVLTDGTKERVCKHCGDIL